MNLEERKKEINSLKLTFNIMKKNLSWSTLLIIGVVGKLVGYLFSDNMFALGVGVIGDVCFIIGIIYFFIFLFHKNKELRMKKKTKELKF